MKGCIKMDIPINYEELTNDEIQHQLECLFEECTNLTALLDMLHLEIRIAYDELIERGAVNSCQH